MEEQHTQPENSQQDQPTLEQPLAPFASQTTEQPRKKRKGLVFTIIVLILFALVGGGAFYVLQKDKKSQPSSNSETKNVDSSAIASSTNTVFCAKLGINSLQCENLDTREVRKYTLPETVKDLNTIIPSPDRSHFMIETHPQDSSSGNITEVLGIYDQKFNLIAELPPQLNADSSNMIAVFSMKWLNNNQLVYTRYVNTENTPSKLYSYDITTKKENEYLTPGVTLEQFMPVLNKNYLLGVQSFVVPEENATKRKLIVIDPTANVIKDVEGGQIDLESYSYNAETDVLYKNTLNGPDQTYDIKAYRIENPTTSPKLVEIRAINGYYASGVASYETIATSKGIFVTHGFVPRKAPIMFYGDEGAVTKTSLASGFSGADILLSLPDFPQLSRANNDQPVTNDFFSVSASTPDKITKFLEARVNDTSACGENNYPTFQLYRNDGDKQFSVMETSCDRNGLAIYAQDGDSYKQLAIIQEGMSCEARDKAGISAKIVDCNLPGEGL